MSADVSGITPVHAVVFLNKVMLPEKTDYISKMVIEVLKRLYAQPIFKMPTRKSQPLL
jgi:hypothetical protein